MSLSECRLRQRVRITAVSVPPSQRLRVHEMGLRDGAVVRVTHHGAFGGVVVAIGGARVALDGATARSVVVEPVAE